MIEMNVDTLLKNFEILSEACIGIDRLRELILNLAVNGRLSTDFDSWITCTLGEVAKIRTGKLDANASSPDGEYPFFTCAREPLRISSYSYDTECVLLAGNGNFDVNYYSGKFDAYQRTYIIEAKNHDELYVPYIFRFMQSYSKKLGEQSIGGVIKYIKISFLTDALILLPTLVEQKRIVSIVDELMALCDQLEIQQKQRDNLRTAARKSAIDAISTATTPEELETAWNRINSNWEVVADSLQSVDALRKLVLDVFTMPKTFQTEAIHKLGDIVSVFNGDRSANYPSKEHRVEFGIPFINAGHLRNGEVEMSEMDYITQNKFLSLKGGKVQDGDLLFCLRGSLGKCAIVNGIKEGAVASSLAILRPNQQANSKYLLRFLQSGSCEKQIKQFDNGSAQPNLAAKSILNFELYLPALSDQELIVAKVDELMALCDQLESVLKSRSEVAEKFARSVVSAA
jgi:restriction endonuclease S subunit